MQPLFYLGNYMQAAGKTLRDLDKDIRKATLTELQNASDDIQSTGRDAVRAWKNKVDFFETNFIIDELGIELTILPEGDGKKIFSYVDLGTKGPYLIFPKKPGGSLYFNQGYSPRTLPIAKYNQGTGKSFGKLIVSKGVIHPGIRGRFFLKTFMEKLLPSLQVRVQTGIAKIV